MTGMTSNRPYLLRALHEWIVDNGMTPLILVNAEAPDVRVPPGHVEDGKIILNISLNAVKGLGIGNDFVRFSARFAGMVEDVQVPISAVQAIYARENNVGMLFPDESPATDSVDGDPPATNSGAGTRPNLRVVK